MPVDIADYGVAVFALWVVGWIIVKIFGPRKSPDLTKVISDNTRALTQLTTLIESQGKMLQTQGEVIQKQIDLFTELRVEIAKKNI